MPALGCIECKSSTELPFQAVSLHNYTRTSLRATPGSATEFSEEEWYLAMLRAHETDDLIRGHRAVMDRYDPTEAIGLVVDEWGAWWRVEPGTNPGFLFQQNTMRDALIASVHFDVFHRHASRVVMANIAQAINVLQAVLITDETTGKLIRTPTFHVFEMGVGHHDADFVETSFKSPLPTKSIDGREVPLLSASASVNGERSLISLSNLDLANAMSLSFDLRGRSLAKACARVLTGDSPAALNSADEPSRVEPVEWDRVSFSSQTLEVAVPPHSYVTVQLDLETH